MHRSRSEFMSNFGILITGVPGSGKSTCSDRVRLNFESFASIDIFVIDVSEIAKSKRLYSKYDEERQCYVIDDRLIKLEVRSRMRRKARHSNRRGKHAVFVLDYHSGSLFPDSWVHRCYVLRCDTSVIYDRLEARGYSESKINENVESEIFNIITHEAQETYAEKVEELVNDNNVELDENARNICAWIEGAVELSEGLCPDLYPEILEFHNDFESDSSGSDYDEDDDDNDNHDDKNDAAAAGSDKAKKLDNETSSKTRIPQKKQRLISESNKLSSHSAKNDDGTHSATKKTILKL